MKTSQCAPLKHHYDACAERVQQQEDAGEEKENCVEECKHIKQPLPRPNNGVVAINANTT